MEQEPSPPPRCKYCRAGNKQKDGWHTLEYVQGYPAHDVFCDEVLAQAADDMAKQPG